MRSSGCFPASIERSSRPTGIVRLLLEKLTPTERAAYILREAFDYAYRDIAEVLQLTEANARQVVTRARQHILGGRTTATSSTQRQRLLGAFIAAAHDGDVARLEHLLASEVVASSDEFVHAA